MNETLQETKTPVPNINPYPAPDLSPEPGILPDAAPGSDPTSPTVSSGDTNAFTGLVSSGDLQTMLPAPETMQAELAVLQDTVADIIPHLERINFTLTAIFWLMLFVFCFKRIRSGVKGFTGRGLDE